MQAECPICMEHMQSSEAISASKCGHVFHEACIARWLGESSVFSVGQCPQCRTVISKAGLTRLFFTHSSTQVNHQRHIDTLTERIAVANKRISELGDDCRRKEDSIVALGDECRQKKATLDKLTCNCRRQASKIDELNDDCEQLNELIDELTDARERKKRASPCSTNRISNTPN